MLSVVSALRVTRGAAKHIFISHFYIYILVVVTYIIWRNKWGKFYSEIQNVRFCTLWTHVILLEKIYLQKFSIIQIDYQKFLLFSFGNNGNILFDHISICFQVFVLWHSNLSILFIKNLKYFWYCVIYKGKLKINSPSFEKYFLDYSRGKFECNEKY